MIFCDLDEYMLSPHRKLCHMIKSNHDTYKFCNVFSELIDNTKLSELPNKFNVSKKYKFNDRSKCIHKLDSIETIGIHREFKYLNTNFKISENYSNCLYHFYNIGGKKRRFKCSDIIDITDLKKLLLFIHIPKTGGTYVEDLFLENGYLVGRFQNKGNFYLGNFKCNKYHVPFKYQDINFNNYITFTILRDPIERFLSEVNYKYFPTFYKNKIKDINKFISFFFDENKKISFDGDCHLIPQIEYIYDKNSNKVINILNQNNLNNDLDNFIKKYNLDINLIEILVNKRRNNYDNYDINSENLKLIKNAYKKDFEFISNI